VIDEIQDFDALSLDLNAMHIKDGIPKVSPPTEPSTVDELLGEGDFFLEVSIRTVTRESLQPHGVGQAFSKNEKSTKIFHNQPIRLLLQQTGLLLH